MTNQCIPDLHTLIMNLNGAVYRCKNDAEWTMEYISDVIENICGYSSADFIENKVRSYAQIIHEEDRQRVYDEIQVALKEKRKFTLEYRIRTSNNRVRWLWEQGSVVYRNGEPLALEGFIEDIHDRKEAEQAIIESREHLRVTFDAMAEAVIVTDMKGKITSMNPVSENLTGWNESEARKQHVTSVFNIKDTSSGNREIDIAAFVCSTLQPQNLPEHTRLISRTGTRYHVTGSAAPIKSLAGDIKGVVMVFRDITADYEIRYALKESEQRLTHAQRISGMGDFILELSTGIVNWSKAMYYLLGYPETRTIDFKFISEKIHHPDDREAINNWLQKCLGSGQKDHQPFEYRLIRKDGRVINVQTFISVIYQGKKPVKVFGTVQDITSLRKAEAMLRESEERYRFLFENMTQGVIYHSETGEVIKANKAAAEILGLNIDQLLGKTSFDPRWRSIHEDGTDFPGDQHPAIITLKTGRPVRNKVMGVYIRQTDSYNWININSIPKFSDDSKKSLQAVVTFEDITLRKKAEEKLFESKETYRNIFHNAQVGLFRTRIADGKILESNDQLARMFGFDSRNEFIAECIVATMYVDQGTRERMIKEINKKGSIQNFLVRFYRKDKSVFWVSYSAKIFPEKGWIEGVAEDITERMQTEAELRTLKEKLEIQVHEKTKELHERVSELERFQEATINRELRMKELRDEIQRLKNALAIKYRTPKTKI